MKKIISVILCIAMLVAICASGASAFVKEGSDISDYPVIIVPGYSSSTLYIGDDFQSGEKIWGLNMDLVLERVLARIVDLGMGLGALTVGNAGIIAETLGEEMRGIFEKMRCNPDGTSVYNVIHYNNDPAESNAANLKKIVGDDAEIKYVGLNHLSWMTSVKVDGEEKIDELIANGFSPKVMANIKDDGFSLETLAAIHALPSSYLQYYYCRNAKLEYLLKGEKSRAQKCMEIEEELLEMYSDEGLYVKPALLDQRGGHKYSLVAVSLINAIANDVGDVQVVNIKNGNTLSFLKPDDVIEVPARIGKNGAEPVDLGEITNRHIIGLMSIVKEYERYTVEAAKTGSNEAALNALLVHPLVGDWEKAVNCFNEMKEAHKDYLPQFFNTSEK